MDQEFVFDAEPNVCAAHDYLAGALAILQGRGDLTEEQRVVALRLADDAADAVRELKEMLYAAAKAA